MTTEALQEIDDHEPVRKDDAGRDRCVCGYIWPCPAVRNAVRELSSEERQLLEALAVDIGWSVEERRPVGAPSGRSGIVVGKYLDDEERTCFRVSYYYRGQRRLFRLRQDELEPAAIGLPNAAFAREHARFLAGLASKKKGAVAPEELELLADALDLYKAIA